MTPADKVRLGLALAREGFDDLRGERLTLARWLDENRRASAGGEQEAIALRYEALRGRQDRVLSGALPPRMRLRDGVPIDAPSPDAETASSLALYVPTGGARTAPAKRGILSRLLAPFDPR